MGDIFGTIGGALVQVVLPTVATAIGGLLIGLLNNQLQKAGIDVTLKDKARFDAVVQDAIRATEEASRRNDLPREDKRANTMKAIVAVTPEKPYDEIMSAIDTQLQVVRAADAPPAAVMIASQAPVSVGPIDPVLKGRKHH